MTTTPNTGARAAVAALLCALLAPAPAALAVDDALYYALGGGEPLTRPASNRPTSLLLGAGVAWNTDLMCGNFDMGLSVSQQLSGAKGAFQDLMGSIIAAASGAVASLPALVLQRVNPALYDLLQNGILQASEEFQLAKVSCEDMTEVMGGVMDGDGWGEVARGMRWREESAAGTEILEARDKAERDGGNGGIVWAGEISKGGKNQPPIAMVRDAVMAGYNLGLHRNAADDSPVSAAACDGAAICEAWGDPKAMAEWVAGVVGDTHIRTCEHCEKKQVRAGMGLNREVEREAQQIETDLGNLVATRVPPTVAELKAVSGSATMAVSRNVIEALREEAPAEQGVIARRLAAEMALARTMERAMLARRALLAGRSEPNIAQTELAQDKLAEYVAELERDIDNLLYEVEIRQRVSTNTAAALIGRSRTRQAVPMVEPLPQARFKDGALQN
ncbi:MAG: integrating conjugative element protein [Parahaliea sp.]